MVKEIPLKDKSGTIVATALCSDEDFDELSKHKWYRSSKIEKKCYLSAKIDGKDCRMHVYVMKLHGIAIPKGHVVHHKNNIRFDNSLENLEVVTTAKNSQSKKKRQDSSSKYYGVSKSRGKYVAQLVVSGKGVYLGIFDKELDAAVAVDRYISHHPEILHKMNDESKRKTYQDEPLTSAASRRPDKKTYNGVFFKQQYDLYEVTTNADGKRHQIGSFKNELDAAIAFDDYVYKNKLRKRLNFPEKYPDFQPTLRIKTTILSEFVDGTIRISQNSNDDVIIIDKDDYDLIKHFSCCIDAQGYASICIGKTRKSLHRYLMNVQDSEVWIDHIDRNKLNNSRKNLRKSNCYQNPQNMSKHAVSKSKYFGVVAVEEGTKFWACRVRHCGKNMMNKSFTLEEDAARLYDLYLMENLSETIKPLNFTWTDEEKTEWKMKLNYSNS